MTASRLTPLRLAALAMLLVGGLAACTSARMTDAPAPREALSFTEGDAPLWEDPSVFRVGTEGAARELRPPRDGG